MTSYMNPSSHSFSQTAPSSSRPARRKTSGLSLRHRKESISSPVLESSTIVPADQTGERQGAVPPSSYFDRYPKEGATPEADRRTSRSRERERSAPPPVKPSSRPTTPKKGKEKREPTPSYAFPTVKQSEAPRNQHGEQALETRSRPRTRTNPGQLRFSGSSSQTQYETPPQTPIEFSPLQHSLDPIRVVVAAPIAGVETMDALVDGMDSYDDDDLYKRLASGSKLGKIGHHPLYHPPLPTPPPGITLGGGKPRATRSNSSQSDEDEEPIPTTPRNRRRMRRPSSPYTVPPSPVTTQRPSTSPTSAEFSANSSIEDIIRRHVTMASPPKPKIVVPSISEIIRKNTPPMPQAYSRPPTVATSSQGHNTLHEESEPEPEPLTPTQEAELISRSSIDSIAEEVQNTLRKSSLPPRMPATPLHHAHSFPHHPAEPVPSARSRTPLSDKRPDSSAQSSSASHVSPLSPLNSPEIELSFASTSSKRPTQKEAIATYLRSTRLTTLLRLTRHPHASREHPLIVSLSDLGSPTGFPLVVFLGLGCVRYVMGLYDEMAECLGIRLIAIDRWGLGRTGTPRSDGSRGIPEWASVVDEVLDLLHIDRCSVMAHSAGAPYAMSFASRYPERIVGDVCLLAPWVGGGEGAGYRWLKYIPNSLLKTAQAAEWKVQAWMLGKPPTITYEGIGYNVKAPLSSSSHTTVRPNQVRAKSEPPEEENGRLAVYPSAGNRPKARLSLSSGTLSDYDDLRDFEGRFESRTTLGPRPRVNSTMNSKSVDSHFYGQSVGAPVSMRKASRGFLRMWKSGTNNQRQQSADDIQSKLGTGRKLKTLKSMSSLKGSSAKSSSAPSTLTQRSPQSPALPEPTIDIDLGFEELKWETGSIPTPPSSMPSRNRHSAHSMSPTPYYDAFPRTGGRRSVSFTTTTTGVSFISTPSMTTTFGTPSNSGHSHGSGSAHGHTNGTSYQAALGNALIAASHAESSKGTHTDLLQILNHDQRPWGFSYAQYPHSVRVWYGDKDERIAENAVRWMERNIGEGKCHVKVVKGADHGLMYRSNVVVEAFEHVTEFWHDDD